MTETDAGALVTEFCAVWRHRDVDQIMSYFTEDAVYENIPMSPVYGREAIREYVAGFIGDLRHIDFTVERQLSQGSLVMNERTDVMMRKGGGELALPVMGVFVIRDGLIAEWRDYFDLAPVLAVFS